MGRLFLFRVLVLGVGLGFCVPVDAGSLHLAGVVERTMAAELRYDPFARFLRITNSGNEPFRIEVSSLSAKQQIKETTQNFSDKDAAVSEQLAVYMNSVVPAQMQRDLDLRFEQPLALAQNTYNVSILAP